MVSVVVDRAFMVTKPLKMYGSKVNYISDLGQLPALDGSTEERQI